MGRKTYSALLEDIEALEQSLDVHRRKIESMQLDASMREIELGHTRSMLGKVDAEVKWLRTLVQELSTAVRRRDEV